MVDLHLLYQLLITAALTGVVGLEREWHGRAAGLRTYILVGLGSCLIMQIAAHLQIMYPNTIADPARLGAQVVSGLGFLGAGAIWKSGASTRGLTTAAGLWVVGGVGLAVGAGFVQGAVMVTGLVLLSLFILSPLKRTLTDGRKRRTARIKKCS